MEQDTFLVQDKSIKGTIGQKMELLFGHILETLIDQFYFISQKFIVL